MEALPYKHFIDFMASLQNNQNNTNASGICPFVMSFAASIRELHENRKDASDAAEKKKRKSELKRKALALLYLDYLIQFRAFPKHDKASSMATYGWHETLREQLLGDFTELATDGSRRRYPSSSQTEKIMLYICIVCLIATVPDYSLRKEQFQRLASELRLAEDKLLLYFREVGCRTDKKGRKAKVSDPAGSHKVVFLAAPLRLPQLRKVAR